MVHIFNTTGRRGLDLDTSYEDILKRTNEEIESVSALIEVVNNNPALKVGAEKSLNKDFIKKDETGKYYLNDMLVKLDLFTIKLEQSIYKNGISIVKNYNKNGIVTTAPEYEKLEGTIKGATKKLSFKEAFLLYATLSKNPFSLEDERKHLATVQPLIVDAYNKLGEDKVKSLRYTKKAVEAALLNLDADNSNEYKIAKVLNNSIAVGFISIADLKKELANTYKNLEIDKKVKSSDIEKYFDCKPTAKRVDGKVTKGYEVFRMKFTFN